MLTCSYFVSGVVVAVKAEEKVNRHNELEEMKSLKEKVQELEEIIQKLETNRNENQAIGSGIVT